MTKDVVHTAISAATKVMTATYILLLAIVGGICNFMYGSRGLLSTLITAVVALLLLITTLLSMRFVTRYLDYAQGIMMGAFAVKLGIVFAAILFVSRAKEICDARIVFVGLAVFITVLTVVEIVALVNNGRRSSIVNK